jgi:hypothetical protein
MESALVVPCTSANVAVKAIDLGIFVDHVCYRVHVRNHRYGMIRGWMGTLIAADYARRECCWFHLAATMT